MRIFQTYILLSLATYHHPHLPWNITSRQISMMVVSTVSTHVSTIIKCCLYNVMIWCKTISLIIVIDSDVDITQHQTQQIVSLLIICTRFQFILNILKDMQSTLYTVQHYSTSTLYYCIQVVIVQNYIQEPPAYHWSCVKLKFSTMYMK